MEFIAGIVTALKDVQIDTLVLFFGFLCVIIGTARFRFQKENKKLDIPVKRRIFLNRLGASLIFIVILFDVILVRFGIGGG
jgi:hypothetical protein